MHRSLTETPGAKAISNEVCVQKIYIDILSKNIFDKNIVLKAMQRRNMRFFVQKLFSIKKIHIFIYEFEKRTMRPAKSHCIYIRRGKVLFIKKQVNMVDINELRTRPDYECSVPNPECSGEETGYTIFCEM